MLAPRFAFLLQPMTLGAGASSANASGTKSKQIASETDLNEFVIKKPLGKSRNPIGRPAKAVKICGLSLYYLYFRWIRDSSPLSRLEGHWVRIWTLPSRST